jgi:hypothetical protein
MIAIAMISFNLFHPGRCLAYKKLAGAKSEPEAKDAEIGVRETK